MSGGSGQQDHYEASVRARELAELSRLRAEVETHKTYGEEADEAEREAIRRARKAEARADRLATVLKRVKQFATFYRPTFSHLLPEIRAALQAEPSPPSPEPAPGDERNPDCCWCPDGPCGEFSRGILCRTLGADWGAGQKPPSPEPAGEACPTCQGKGKLVLKHCPAEARAGPCTVTHYEPCPACDGTGRGA